MKEQFSNEEHEGAILTHYILRNKELRFEHFNVLLLPQNSFLQNKKMYGSMELGLQGCWQNRVNYDDGIQKMHKADQLLLLPF